MRCSTCIVRGLYRSGSLKTAARELGRCRVDLVGVQEVSWDKGGVVRVGGFYFLIFLFFILFIYLFIYFLRRKQNSSIGNRIFCTPLNSKE